MSHLRRGKGGERPKAWGTPWVEVRFPGSSAGKESTFNTGDSSLTLGLERSPGRDRLPTPVFLGFPGGSDGKESACHAGDLGSIPGLGRSPGGGHGNSLQYSSLENPHGQRSLAGYSPWSCKESDTTVQLSTPPHMLKTQRPRQSRVLFPSFIWTKLKSLAFKTQNFCCFHNKNTHHFFSLKVFWGVLFWI